jgi:hypothetical protein
MMAGKKFSPGGQKGKLHHALGVPTDKNIPPGKLKAALHSNNTGVRNMAVRAKTMAGWDHSGGKRKSIYSHPRSPKE